MSADYVRVFRGDDGDWYYEARAGNNQVLSTSEGYTRIADALRGARDEFPGVRVEETE